MSDKKRFAHKNTAFGVRYADRVKALDMAAIEACVAALFGCTKPERLAAFYGYREGRNE